MSECKARRSFVLFACAIALLGACNKSEISDLVGKVKQTASESTEKVSQAVSEQIGETADQVQEQLNLAGSIELTLDSPIASQACYAQLIRQGSGRPNVLQLRSYRSADNESFPSVFLQAQVQADSPSELVGQIVSSRLFVQPTADGPLWYSATGNPVELKVVSVEEHLLTAELAGGLLQSTTDGAEVKANGTFCGVLD